MSEERVEWKEGLPASLVGRPVGVSWEEAEKSGEPLRSWEAGRSRIFSGVLLTSRFLAEGVSVPESLSDNVNVCNSNPPI